jgi:putative oxidoreductase
MQTANTTETETSGSDPADWAPLLLRLVVGIGFVMHGYAKWSRGPSAFGAVLEILGVPLPLLLAWATTAVELAGGIAILAGAWVRLASIPLAIVLLTALVTVHLPYGFFSVKLVEVTPHGIRFGSVGYELVLLYLGGLAALATGGAGALSVDHWRQRRR